MPKSSPAKKRRRERRDKVSKHLKRKTRQTTQPADEKVQETCINISPHENLDVRSDRNEEGACSSQSLDIDEELDKNASKNNLSVFNVKSIIHVSIAWFNCQCWKNIFPAGTFHTEKFFKA